VNTYPISMHTLPYVFRSFERGVRCADVDNPKVVNGIHRHVGFVGSPQTAIVLVEDEVLSLVSGLRVREVDRVRL